MTKSKSKKNKPALQLAGVALQLHFGRQRIENLVTSSRTFPITARPDVQTALEKLLAADQKAVQLGIHTQHLHETLTVANLISDHQHYPVVVGPLQYEELDIGNVEPARCVRQALWLSTMKGAPYALLLSPSQRYGQANGVHIEIVVTPGEAGLSVSRNILERLEELVKTSGSYRGKVLSLEQADRYSGHSGVIRVHKLRSVRREDVILPHKTLQLLDRNITEFIRQREQLRKLGMQSKKGLLFYGPPGTGKTHTIHYLANQLPDHTTLLITAEQVGLLDHYFQLARFLQPAMLVLEDVDLIARAREEMHGPCEESMLNKLLNEMDGLREDTAILFVLTTNRPEHLEAALASRPGRVDQAIEFPLPDEHGRRLLVKLYAGGLPLSEEIVTSIVKKTKGASAAFIKELMRRSAQFYLQGGGNGELKSEFINEALEEMLFSGGSLNVKLLGGALAEAQSAG